MAAKPQKIPILVRSPNNSGGGEKMEAWKRKLKVEDLVRCVVCLEVPRGPVLQCGGSAGGGHITCDVCDRENEACPECEERGKRVRVAVVEKVNKYAIKYVYENDRCLCSWGNSKAKLFSYGKLILLS